MMKTMDEKIFSIDRETISRKKALRVEYVLNASLIVVYLLVLCLAVKHTASSFVTSADVLADSPLALVDNAIDVAFLCVWAVVGVFLGKVVLPIRHVHDYKDLKCVPKKYPLYGVIDVGQYRCSTELCRYLAKQLGQTDGRLFFRKENDNWGDSPKKVRNFFLVDRIGRWRDCRVCVREGGSIHPRLIIWDRYDHSNNSVEIDLSPLFHETDDCVSVNEPMLTQFLTALHEQKSPLNDFANRIKNTLSDRTYES